METYPPETYAPPLNRSPRPGWSGFRWGAAAGALYSALLGGVVGYAANIYGSGVESIPLGQRLFEIAIFLLPMLLVSTVLGAIGGAITLWLIHWLLKRLSGVRRGSAWLVALGVCLLLMLLVASPVLAILYTDGNFWRGLEESLIVGIPFYFLPGIFYIVAMVWATLRNFNRWFPNRNLQLPAIS